ncbi:MAG: hypothetical protein MUF49_19875, partial [Oculatellaceae cyanobacterium Prado106]|nr:hypothetical protein [Oculatellaceae cyanobacterium Prado106]
MIGAILGDRLHTRFILAYRGSAPTLQYGQTLEVTGIILKFTFRRWSSPSAAEVHLIRLALDCPLQC